MKKMLKGEWCTIQHLPMKLLRSFQKKEEVLQELKAAIQACENMHELLDLLFSTDFPRDEAFLNLFAKRIEELDAHYQAHIILHF